MPAAAAGAVAACEQLHHRCVGCEDAVDALDDGLQGTGHSGLNMICMWRRYHTNVVITRCMMPLMPWVMDCRAQDTMFGMRTCACGYHTVHVPTNTHSSSIARHLCSKHAQLAWHDTCYCAPPSVWLYIQRCRAAGAAGAGVNNETAESTSWQQQLYVWSTRPASLMTKTTHLLSTCAATSLCNASASCPHTRPA